MRPPLAYTAQAWPIAAAMLPFGPTTRDGVRYQDAGPEVWAGPMRLVKRLGFDHLDATDNWMQVADLDADRLRQFGETLAECGLAMPAISTSRRSIIDADHGEEYLAYGHRLLDAAATLGTPMVSFGLFQDLTEAQQKATWFWLVDGHKDDPDDRAAWNLAASRLRELGEHAASNGQQISLEMYEDTYLGSAESAVRLLEDIACDAVGLNPDIGNFVRLHRPLPSLDDTFAAVLPHANFWHVKNYTRDEDPQGAYYATHPIGMESGYINYRAVLDKALDLGYSGPFLCEHYGTDSLAMMAHNMRYLRSLLADAEAEAAPHAVPAARPTPTTSSSTTTAGGAQ